ncbi:8-amino-7-oxononanoate synthase [Chitinilyticum litopenaei]|uniref:8-amino-7-oxononanoate synthase n=1 Tax=Chitinilyticum litopenaei TaxID=1121276 RepID=UPI000401F5BE|nr:8-amino-7-oxononanoate synthase [Chitinilyticum litopenaei]
MPVSDQGHPSAVFAELSAALQQREAAGLLRRRRELATPQGALVEVDGQSLVNFCSNDYLGLAAHPALIAAAQDGAARWGVGSGASHLVSGHFTVHEQFEQAFAALVGRPAALSFATGYLANLAVVTALVGRDDAVFADKLNHASLNDAVTLSRAEFKRFAHNDVTQLERLLAASTARRKLIVVDAVFSMDGDLAPLAELLTLAERYDALLYVDDAHGFGVLGDGRGTLAELGLASPRLIQLATLGKAAGLGGAMVAAEPVVIDWLVNAARPYIYTTAAPPLLAQAGLASLRLIAEGAGLRDRLRRHVATFRAALQACGAQLLDSATPIQPILVQDNQRALALSDALRARGYWVAAIRPPTVPTPRLRLCFSAAHSDEQVAGLCATLQELLRD